MLHDVVDGELCQVARDFNDDTKALRELLSRGVDPNKRNRRGWLALGVAARNGNVECVKVGSRLWEVEEFTSDGGKVLLAAKAEVNLRDGNSVTALADAAAGESDRVVECVKVRQGDESSGGDAHNGQGIAGCASGSDDAESCPRGDATSPRCRVSSAGGVS